ncbi:uncharacterized protein SPSK_06778 [Sporothrix schenckii 1099-18]|uniref:Uncharacterized protein n=1 Tax=Sporothrix schenckii 1099-18 TaxID=1397361 RepID=A0A0F2MM49_SPOSC|nr:uncharacterized protein SPSK_06778 [Sporothrix schenckii 1099-18]KJR89920.1 hypothetical protein SPSK_06778 [Sporothrix schenckii 1099-18]
MAFSAQTQIASIGNAVWCGREGRWESEGGGGERRSFSTLERQVPERHHLADLRTGKTEECFFRDDGVKVCAQAPGSCNDTTMLYYVMAQESNIGLD